MRLTKKEQQIASIEGYAAIFNTPDLAGDILAPECFGEFFVKKFIPPSKIRPMMLYQHKVDCPIGRWTKLSVDKVGLFVQGEILLESASAFDVYNLISGGAIDGLSIGFRALKSRKNKRAQRIISSVDLWEISVVSFPMAPLARISHVSAPQILKDPERTGLVSAQPARRASFPPSGARHFVEALKGAADIMSQ